MKSGFRMMENAEVLKNTKRLSKVKKLNAYKMGERGQKQMLQGLKGLGLRVGVPAALTYTTLT